MLDKRYDEAMSKATIYYQTTQRTIEDICKEVGFSKSYFYKHYTGPKRGERNKGRKYKLNINKLIEDSHDKYYWLGFISADGSIVERTLAIELKSDDEEHLRKFIKFLESDVPIKNRINNSGCHCSKVNINSLDLIDYLAKYNIIPNKSSVFTIPLNNIPKEYIYDFARGMIDGDGSIQIQKDNQLSLTFCSGNRTCAEQMRDILGIKNVVSYNSGVYHFQVKGNNVAKKVLDKIYLDSTDDNRLTRKYNIYLQTLS